MVVVVTVFCGGGFTICEFYNFHISFITLCSSEFAITCGDVLENKLLSTTTCL